MTKPDALYLGFVATGLLLDHFVLWPAFVRRSHADAGRARRFLWKAWMILLWTLAAAGIVLWMFEARPWAALRLTLPHGVRLWAAIVLVSALAMAYARTLRRIARSSRVRRIKMDQSSVARLVPHSSSELRAWIALSATAGFCEECVFRGYLTWVLQPAFGLWGAAALSVVLFGAAHAYQGAKGMLAAGAVGAVLTLTVLAFGSLVPAMAVHAIVDIGEGVKALLVLGKASAPGLAPGPRIAIGDAFPENAPIVANTAPALPARGR